MDRVGKVSIIQAVLFYGATIVSYGFNYSGTIEVAKGKYNDHSGIFSVIISSKIYLSVLSSFLTFSILFFFKLNSYELFIIYFSFLIYFIGQSIFPEWFFHGLQKVGYSLLTIVIWKISYLIAIFFFVTRYEDYLFIIFYDSLLLFFASLGSFFFTINKCGVKFKLSKLAEIKKSLLSNWYLFSSILMTTFYTKGNYLFLGLCNSQVEVAVYTIVERYIFMINGLLSLVNRILLPYIGIFKEKKIGKYIYFLQLITIAILIVGLLLCFLNLIFAEWVVNLLNDQYHDELLGIFRILSLSFIPASFCTFVTFVLISEKKSNQINQINLIGFLGGIVWVAPLTFFFGGLGLAVGFVSNFYFLFILNGVQLIRLKKQLLSNNKLDYF